MAIGDQFGLVKETTYGTYVAPTRFLPFSTESLSRNQQKIRSFGIGRGLYQRSDAVRTVNIGAGGDVAFDLLNKGFGILFELMLGSVATSQPDAINEPLHYLHTFTPDTDGRRGLFATLQKGLEDSGGTVNPFSYVGAKLLSWGINIQNGQPIGLTTTWDAKDEDPDQALAVASYASNAQPFIGEDVAITIDGVTEKIKQAAINGENAVDTERRFLGNVKEEPLPNAEFPVTGTLDKEFTNSDLYDDFVAGTLAKLVITSSFGEIDAGQSNPFKFVITIEEIEYTGGTPQSAGAGVNQQSIPFKALYDGTNPLIKIEYHTTDTTP